MTLSVENLTIRHGDKAFVNKVNFTVNNGEIVTLMGPSGCGKSSLLDAIAGHLSPAFHYQGDILLNQQQMNLLAPNQRKIGLLFQDDLLFPHLNIWENLAFALPRQHKKNTRKMLALETLTQIGLKDIADQMPVAISGGQRARVSVMRTLLAKPEAVLLDEPFSKLDKTLRRSFRAFVFEHIKVQNIPALLVTHDENDIPLGGRFSNWPWINFDHLNKGGQSNA